MDRDKPTAATPPDPRALAELAHDARTLVAFQAAMGIDSYPATPALRQFLRPDTGDSLKKTDAAPDRSRRTPAAPPSSSRSLDDIREELDACSRCPRHEGREKIVFGKGKAGAKLFIVGEFPTAEDGFAGQPFQGETGQLLIKMLGAIGLDCDDVYLANLVKCWPADGHEPQPQEITACQPFLLQQIAAVQPKIICAMGGLAAQTLLHSKKNLLQLRGAWHTCQQIPLMPTFSPVFLLRNPEMKKAAWVDLQLIQKRLAATAPR